MLVREYVLPMSKRPVDLSMAVDTFIILVDKRTQCGFRFIFVSSGTDQLEHVGEIVSQPFRLGFLLVNEGQARQCGRQVGCTCSQYLAW